MSGPEIAPSGPKKYPPATIVETAIMQPRLSASVFFAGFAPQPGQNRAVVEIVRPHSPHVTSAIPGSFTRFQRNGPTSFCRWQLFGSRLSVFLYRRFHTRGVDCFLLLQLPL
jgi:hypothetical protein